MTIPTEKSASKIVNPDSDLLEADNFYISKKGNLCLNTTDDFTVVIFRVRNLLYKWPYDPNRKFLDFETIEEKNNFFNRWVSSIYKIPQSDILIFKKRRFYQCSESLIESNGIRDKILNKSIFVSENGQLYIVIISAFLMGLLIGKKLH